MAERLKRRIEFKIPHNVNFKEKVLAYFALPGFELSSQGEDRFEFKNKSFFFNTWTFNPLNWESEVTICKSNRNIRADFSLNLVGQLYTKQEIEVWNSFVQNFKLYLTENFDYKEDLWRKVKVSKLAGWKLFGIILLIGILLIPIGVYLNNQHGLSLIIFFLIPILAGYFINQQRIRRLKNGV